MNKNVKLSINSSAVKYLGRNVRKESGSPYIPLTYNCDHRVLYILQNFINWNIEYRFITNFFVNFNKRKIHYNLLSFLKVKNKYIIEIVTFLFWEILNNKAVLCWRIFKLNVEQTIYLVASSFFFTACCWFRWFILESIRAGIKN